MKIIIIGGVAGGASAAARLRRLSEEAEIILMERGKYISFANCGLPYYIGGEIEEREALLLQTPEAFHARFNVDVRVENEVIAIDKDDQLVKVRRGDGTEYDESYDKIILSPGSTPLRPPLPGIDVEGIFTLWTIPDVDRIKAYVDTARPQKAVVVGGGFIGLEMAENLQHRGAEVHLVEMQDQVMTSIDFEMAQKIHEHMEQEGVHLHLSVGVSSFSRENGRTRVSLNNDETIDADIVLLSIGVRPQSNLAKDAGLDLNRRGGIIVNEELRSSDPNIYAVGDAIEVRRFPQNDPAMIPLAGPANKQGRMVAANVLGGHETYQGTQGSSIAKVFDIHAGSTGLSEKALIALGKEYGKDYDIVMIHPNSHAGYYPGAMPLSIKMLFDRKTRKILGAQAVGYDGVDKRIDVLATALRLGATIDDLTRLELAYAPPFSSGKDPVNMAGFVAENMLDGKVKNLPWNRIDTIENAQLVDVREAIESDMGSINGSILLPIDELRERFSELDKTRPVIVYCAVGVRGYLASRILLQNGFSEVYNLSGGWATWSSAHFETGKAPLAPMPELSEVTMHTPSAESKPLMPPETIIPLNACGLSCPGPIQAINNKIAEIQTGQAVEIRVTDPGFRTDIGSWCKRTGNTLLKLEKRGLETVALVQKGGHDIPQSVGNATSDHKTIVVFSGDLDKAIASFIIANGAAAMGKKVTLFFTFWGLNILRKPEKVRVKKNFISRMFGAMMPRGAGKLGLSRMNMGGMGAGMIKGIMKKHQVPQLQEMMRQAKQAGITLIACNMSMDLMGISAGELIDGVELGGVASYLDAAEDSNVNLFI